jgi:hypothetical protein
MKGWERDGGGRWESGEEGQETTRRSIYDYVTRLSIELFKAFSTSRRLTPSPSNSHFPPASLYRYAKSAWVSIGNLEDADCFRLPSIFSLNLLAKSFEIVSARSTTSMGTPARFATCVPKEDVAIPSISLYRNTSYGELRTDCGAKSQNPYLPLFIVDQCLHVHVPDIRVVCVIVCQRPVVGGKKGQSQCMRGQSMQDSL